MPFGNSKSLSRRDMLRIAQRFSVGLSRRDEQVPKGRLSEVRSERLSAVPSGRGLPPRGSPTLKRWAIVECPFGTAFWRLRGRNCRKALGLARIQAVVSGNRARTWPTASSIPPERSGRDSQQLVVIPRQQVTGFKFDTQDMDRHADTHDPEAGMKDDGAARKIAESQRPDFRHVPARCSAKKEKARRCRRALLNLAG